MGQLSARSGGCSFASLTRGTSRQPPKKRQSLSAYSANGTPARSHVLDRAGPFRRRPADWIAEGSGAGGIRGAWTALSLLRHIPLISATSHKLIVGEL